MLTYFSVSNFRGFRDRIELRLDQASDYHFNQRFVSGNIVMNGLIYGENGAGKTSLLRAMAHIVPILTNNYVGPNLVSSMDCGNSDYDPNGPSVFCYRFLIDDEAITYEFGENRFGLLYEKLYSNEKLVIDTNKKPFFIDKDFFPELRKSGWEQFYDPRISLLKFLGRSGIKIEKNTIAKVVRFAEGFLLARSVIDGNQFVGVLPRSETLTSIFTDQSVLKAFQTFLKENGIDYKLSTQPSEDPRAPKLIVVFKKEQRDFFAVASSGTRYLLLVFYWLHSIKGKASMICFDEFDAYFHDDSALAVFRLIASQGYQSLVTTHRTFLMNNKYARPDILFNLQNGRINSFSSLSSDRELREGHNVEKMYRGGAFNDTDNEENTVNR